MMYTFESLKFYTSLLLIFLENDRQYLVFCYPGAAVLCLRICTQHLAHDWEM